MPLHVNLTKAWQVLPEKHLEKFCWEIVAQTFSYILIFYVYCIIDTVSLKIISKNFLKTK